MHLRPLLARIGVCTLAPAKQKAVRNRCVTQMGHIGHRDRYTAAMNQELHQLFNVIVQRERASFVRLLKANPTLARTSLKRGAKECFYLR